MTSIRTTKIFLQCALVAWLMTAATAEAQTTYQLTAFGAVCDGVTDDSTAIQSAFDTVKNGHILQFPAGQVCFHTQTLVINNGLSFVFEGNDATLRVAKGKQGTLIKRSHGYTLRNLTFDGNRQLSCSRQDIPACFCDNCPEDLLLLRGSTRNNALPGEVTLPTLLSNVQAIRSTRVGIRVRGFTLMQSGQDNPTTDLTLTACSALDNEANGMAISASERIDVLGGTYADTGSGVLPGAGIDVENDLDEVATDVLISGATLRDNYGNGVQLGVSNGGVTDGITLVGNTFQSNLRGAVRVRAINVTIDNNTFEDFHQPSFDQDAAIRVFPEARDVDIDNNLFRRFSTGQAVILVDPGAERVRVRTNTFEDINVLAATGAAIHHEATDATLTDNSFHDLGYRGIFSTASGAVITGNSFDCMRGNVIWAGAGNAQIDNNVLGSPAAAGSMAASQAVIRSRGDGGSVNGNQLVCLGMIQRGIVLDNHPSEVKNNQVTNCDPLRWLQFLNGQGTTLVSGNVRTTSSVSACIP